MQRSTSHQTRSFSFDFLKKKTKPLFYFTLANFFLQNQKPSDCHTTTTSGGRQGVERGPFLAPVWSILESHETKTQRCRKRGDFQPLLDPISATATERRAPTTRLRRSPVSERGRLVVGSRGGQARVAAEKIKVGGY
ncbi:hypothetical protein ES319_A05G227600v1 [Gossypium barbadense]|uniref:Uncharacterized protein n=2 Tax=Gossypium TaxID=3633 RepID=A0A5J5VRZ1_GOSBA|nr:hypothetical protein ES319_A05G227600v1 [Gossypium barbadense]